MDKEKKQNLSFISVAFMYVSTIMGAGFASGRETWQYFGIFGEKGKIGVILVSVLFAITGAMTAYIARKLGTSDMGRIIVPGNNEKLINVVGYGMAVFLFSVLLTMTAAGSSLLNQQFNIPLGIGGIIIALMVLATILGGFERISRVFRFIMPVLFATVIITAIIIALTEIPAENIEHEIVITKTVPNWAMGAAIYISYNMLAMIPFVAKSAIHAKSDKAGIGGSALGGVFLGAMAILIVLAIQKDMPFSDSMDLPMMGYATKISNILGIWYFIVLFFAVYSAATSNFYGCTTKIKEGPKKKLITIVLVAAAYGLGLFGFKNIVAYMFAIEGYIGFIIMAMIVVNFLKIYRENKGKSSNN